MGPSHPDLNALAALMEGRLSGPGRAAVVTHLVDCLECRTVVATHARGQGASRSGFRHPAVWLPVAAALALATTAAVMVWRADRGTPALPSAAPTSAAPAQPAPDAPTVAAPAAPVQVPTPVAPPPKSAERPNSNDALSTRRGAVRTVQGKTFTLVAGEWIDRAYDPVALLPARDIVGPEARSTLLERTPALRPYAALGPRLTVVYDGVVYRFR